MKKYEELKEKALRIFPGKISIIEPFGEGSVIAHVWEDGLLIPKHYKITSEKVEEI